MEPLFTVFPTVFVGSVRHALELRVSNLLVGGVSLISARHSCLSNGSMRDGLNLGEV